MEIIPAFIPLLKKKKKRNLYHFIFESLHPSVCHPSFLNMQQQNNPEEKLADTNQGVAIPGCQVCLCYARQKFPCMCVRVCMCERVCIILRMGTHGE